MVVAVGKTPLETRIENSQDYFIKSYEITGTIKSACKATNIGRTTFYDWMKSNKFNFCAKFDEAKATFREALEELMFTRLQDPKCHPVLIIFALKGHWREKYGDVPMAGDDAAKDTMLELKRWYREQISQPNTEDSK